MNPLHKSNKQHVRRFMQEHYSDERLAMLLAHAQSGKLSFHSCCCFIGITTADHALEGETWVISMNNHLGAARDLFGAVDAENAFMAFGPDSKRRRILIPMIKAEFKRRELTSWVPYESVQEELQEELVAV